MLSTVAPAASAPSYSRRYDPAQLKSIHLPINYDSDASIDLSIKHTLPTFVDLFRTFIQSYGGKEGLELGVIHSSLPDEGCFSKVSIPKYMAMLQEVANLQRTSVTICLDDMIEYDENGYDDLVRRIQRNTHYYLTIFSRVLDELMPASSFPTDMSSMDVIDVIASHRRARLSADNGTEYGTNADSSAPLPAFSTTANAIPATLLRRYQLSIKPRRNLSSLAVRQVGAELVGALVNVKGIITRVGEVHPLLQVGTYTCERCGYEIYQEVKGQSYMPLIECPTDACRVHGIKGKLVLQTRGSKFQKSQEVRIQELTDQVPIGHIPRTMAVTLVGDLTRAVNPGDQVIISGIHMPKPYSGFKAVKAGLLTDTFLYAQHIVNLKPKYGTSEASEAQSIDQQVEALSRDPDIYGRLARSIAPEIYGHEDVKKAILLLMVGGVPREMSDGMRIRGDINICLMGDPGVAKSQLLKYITKVSPRAVYTTGKGSSGVGLTASVTRDPISNEMLLEGGALVLADNGICCIDEFDKMEDGDRTAIHEVMEQQTISISKAGITTTLNARTSILAAANPLYGRYNPKKSPRENINLPPALLSRFDLLFLILDQADIDQDTRLASHVCEVHRSGYSPTSSVMEEEGISSDVLRAYIGLAKTYSPMIPNSLIEYIVGAYVGLRLNDLQHKDSTYTTPRTLLAILRLSQALARLRLSSIVTQADLDEAMRLMEVSRSSVDIHMDRSHRNGGIAENPLGKILALIRDLSLQVEEVDENGRRVSMDAIRDAVHARGFTDSQLQQCLVSFDELNIWHVAPDGRSLLVYN